MIPLLAFAAVVAGMAAELRVSRRHERLLRAAGAREAPGDVYPWMRVIYPACFAAMTVEGLLAASFAPSWSSRFIGPTVVVVGAGVWIAAKALKAWAIRSLGDRWSFRVLVQPGSRLVASGPYRYLRHPNYLAIVGELVGIALVTRAPLTGIASLVVFGLLLRTRILVEEHALGLRSRLR